MTATIHYITKTHNRAVVKITATSAGDAVTIPIGDNLCVAGQYSVDPKINISTVAYSVSSAGHTSINRNGEVLRLFGHGTISYGDVEQVSSNIDVSFVDTAGGTVILELSKTDGFSAVNPIEVDSSWQNIQSLYVFPNYVEQNY